MTRTTVDYGIDLGTTNSVIAVVNHGEVEIIKNGIHSITPSQVFIDRRGTIHRGHAAAQNLIRLSVAADVHAEFKREMGQKTERHFERAQVSLSPENLSAEVLKELRRAAGDRGEEPQAAVITVPAMFELPQNDATARAAKLAGFSHSLLLQEPVAAAIAYGFDTDADRVYWLVYDFGGGTFDASIISVRDGQISVVRHGGDNYLGGSDFDRCIVDQLLVPTLKDEYDLSTLSRSNASADRLCRSRLAALKTIAEEVKMSLSREQGVDRYFENAMEDDSGEPVDVECKLSRETFEKAISPMVQRSLDITSRLIADAGLRPEDIDKVLMVGGSTFVPLVQRQVETLGIPLDSSRDPMTVVAYGAARFASSKRMPKALAAAQSVAVGVAKLALEYEPVGKDLTPVVGGRLTINDAAPPSGTVITIGRSDNGWTSGDVQVDHTGVFFTNVHLREKGRSTFGLGARDASGEIIQCVPDQFAITYGTTVAKATLSRALSIGLADGTAQVLIPAGTSLPARSDVQIRQTVQALEKGDSTAVLRIPFLSGDEQESELNLCGMLWRMQGSDLDRTLPAGSDVEIMVEVNESGTTLASISIPFLDAHHELAGDSEVEHEPAEVMQTRLQDIHDRLERLYEKALTSDETEAATEVALYRESGALGDIQEKVQLWNHDDHQAAGQARALLVDAATKVRELEARVDWPARINEFETRKVDVRKTVHEHGNDADRQNLDSLLAKAERFVVDKESRMLARVMNELWDLNYAVIRRDPAFWAGYLHHLAEEEHRFVDRARGRQLLSEGMSALRRGDVASAETIARDLLRMLPPEVQQEAKARMSDIQ